MKAKLQNLLVKGRIYLTETSEKDIANKPSAEKWSKKEILGHLIDSGINNLQRFTQIQFYPKPYQIKTYNQNELVKANHYQLADTKKLLTFWLSINYRILDIMDMQTVQSLSYEIILGNGEKSNLECLMEDYVSHLEHHLNQILSQ
jgi:hypothetical protein